jgi:hypothetical protein
MDYPSDVKLIGALVSQIGLTASVNCQVTLNTVRVELCVILERWGTIKHRHLWWRGGYVTQWRSRDQAPLTFASAAPKD